MYFPDGPRKLGLCPAAPTDAPCSSAGWPLSWETQGYMEEPLKNTVYLSLRCCWAAPELPGADSVQYEEPGVAAAVTLSWGAYIYSINTLACYHCTAVSVDCYVITLHLGKLFLPRFRLVHLLRVTVRSCCLAPRWPRLASPDAPSWEAHQWKYGTKSSFPSKT